MENEKVETKENLVSNETNDVEKKPIEKTELNIDKQENLNQDISGDSYCLKCQTPLKENQQFCPKCGTERGATNNKTCSKCGCVLEPGEKFCSKCGEKAKIDFQSDIIENIQNNTKKNKFSKKEKIIFGIAIAIIISGIVFCTTILPKLMISTTELLSEGNYAEAYKKAKDDEKEKILIENLIAYISYDASESLKDPSSFVLRDAWYDKDNQSIVLYLNGNNSYGASVDGYWYYTYDEDDNEYQLYVSLSALEEENYYSWDSYSEKLEIILKNAARRTVKSIISDDTLKVDKNSISNINSLFKKDLLDDIELLSENKNISTSNSL